MDEKELRARAAADLALIREKRPLVHQITNYVVMNITANITLLVGASPVMAHTREEVVDMVGLAGALVLNPGTLEPAWVEAMMMAGKRAGELGIPVVLDPVGAGATPYRTETNLKFLEELDLSIIRGNSGEIGALSGAGGTVVGVDSIEGVADPAEVTSAAARSWGNVVAITGERDIISNGETAVAVDNGHRWLTSVTGTGCMATTMIASFAAVEEDHLVAAAAALACYGLAAEIGAGEAGGPGTFQAAMFDALYNMTPERLEEGARISVITPC